MKIKVGVFFGGKSVEHEISVITMSQAIASLNPDKYEIYTISLDDALSEEIIEEHYYEVYLDDNTNEKYKISISEEEIYDKILDGKMVVYDADSLVDGINVVFASKENVILEEDTSKISKEHEKMLIKATANN